MKRLLKAATLSVGAMSLSAAALGQLQVPSKEREEALLQAQQRLENARNAANDANRRVREAESNASLARMRAKAANEGLERAEQGLEQARTRAAAALEAFQSERARFDELRKTP